MAYSGQAPWGVPSVVDSVAAMNTLKKLVLGTSAAAALSVVVVANPAHAAYGGGCDLEVHGTKGNISLTEHVTSDTCEQPVAAWALCQPYLPMSWPSINTGASITKTGDIWVGCTAGYVVEGGYTYQPTYGSAWVRVQNT